MGINASAPEIAVKPFPGLKSAARDQNVAASTAFLWQAESAQPRERAKHQFRVPDRMDVPRFADLRFAGESVA
jgi:hypothetical protein